MIIILMVQDANIACLEESRKDNISGESIQEMRMSQQLTQPEDFVQEKDQEEKATSTCQLATLRGKDIQVKKDPNDEATVDDEEKRRIKNKIQERYSFQKQPLSR